MTLPDTIMMYREHSFRLDHTIDTEDFRIITSDDKIHFQFYDGNNYYDLIYFDPHDNPYPVFVADDITEKIIHRIKLFNEKELSLRGFLKLMEDEPLSFKVNCKYDFDPYGDKEYMICYSKMIVDLNKAVPLSSWLDRSKDYQVINLNDLHVGDSENNDTELFYRKNNNFISSIAINIKPISQLYKENLDKLLDVFVSDRPSLKTVFETLSDYGYVIPFDEK